MNNICDVNEWNKKSVILINFYIFHVRAIKHVVYFLKRFIAQTVYTVCTRVNYKTVPVTSLNKYSHCGTSGTE